MTRRFVVVAIALIALLGLAGARIAYEAYQARDALVVARARLVDARAAVAAGRFGLAIEQARGAAEAATVARSRTDGPLWAVARQLPVAGATPQALTAVAEVAAAAAALTVAGLEEAGGLLDGGSTLPLRAVDGAVDLASLEEASEVVAALPVTPLRSAREQLSAIGTRFLASDMIEARSDALEAADELLMTVDRLAVALDVVPALLGADDPRRYLVTIQNPAELRGTGGLIGFLATLETDRGALRITQPRGVEGDRLAGGTDVLVRGAFGADDFEDDPVAAPPAFADRYAFADAGWLLANTNLDPDLPTVAPIELAIYERVTGDAPQGVVVIDPVGLQRLYEAIGPLDVPDRLATLAPDLPDPIPSGRIAEVLLVDAYDALGGATDERRAYQAVIAQSALAGFLERPWDPVDVARAVGDMLAGRHLQVFSTDPDEQAALERLGVAGELRAAAEADDLIAVTANNNSGSKSDVHVAHRLTADIELIAPRLLDDDEVVDRRVRTTFEVVNGLGDEPHDDYIDQPLQLPDEQQAPPSGTVRTWVTGWIPLNSTITSVTGADREAVEYFSDEIHGRMTVDRFFLEVPPAQSTSVTMESTATVPIGWDGRRASYGLTVWRQGKAVPDHLDVAITAPDDWRIEDAVIAGGGSPRGMGPRGDGPPISIDRTDRRVEVRGAVTSDLRIEVTLLAPSA